MTRPLDIARRVFRARIARSLARCRQAMRPRRQARPVAAAPEARPFVFPEPRTLYRQELLRLEREQFPLWRPDPEKVRALQSHGA